MQGDESKSTSTSDEPTYIGPYLVECLLRKGGMSLLYLALHKETQQPTTIKVLLPKYLSNPDVVDRFLKEAEIISLADHPNIIKFLGYGQWEKGLFIAMEYIEGISLRQFILQTPVSLKRSLEILLDIAYALCHLHTHGVIHRDLKPENILITEKGEVKVIDFGIAQLLSDTVQEGQPRHFIGTPVYMSPEQQKNPMNVCFSSDIYSLGIIAYELITGKLSRGHVHISQLPKGLQPILHKALQAETEERYQNIVDFITDVSTYVHSEEFEKEKKKRDRLSEFSGELEKARTFFHPQEIKNLPFVAVEEGRIKGSLPEKALYYFSPAKKGTLVFFADAPHADASILYHFAALRGMLSSLSEMPFEQILKKLSDLLKKEAGYPPFAAGLLFFEKDLVHAALFGHLHILKKSEDAWHLLPHQNASLIECDNVRIDTFPWDGEAQLFMHSTSHQLTPVQLKQLLEEESPSHPKKFAESLQRKLRFSSFPIDLESTFSFYLLHRSKDL